MRTRDDILGIKAHTETVSTAAWGPVIIRQLTGADYGRLMAILDMPPGAEKMAALVVLGCTTPVFRDEDVPKLARGPMEPLNEVGTAVLSAAGIGLPDEKKTSDPMNTPLSTSPIASASPIPIK